MVKSVKNGISSGVRLRSIQRSIVSRKAPVGTNIASIHQPIQGAEATTPTPSAPTMTRRALPMRALASTTRRRCAGVGHSHTRSDSMGFTSA